jgi:hypothetical protein
MKKLYSLLITVVLSSYFVFSQKVDSPDFGIKNIFKLEDDISNSIMSYIYVTRPTFNNVPVKETYSGPIMATANGYGFGLGFSLYSERFTLGTRFDFSSAEFSGFPEDYMTRSTPVRRLNYYIFDLIDGGYIPVYRKIPISMHARLGIGVLTQSNFSESFDNYLGETEYPIHAGLELRIGLIKHLFFKLEWSVYFEGVGAGDDKTTIYYYDEKPKGKDFGSRISIGLALYRLKYFN